MLGIQDFLLLLQVATCATIMKNSASAWVFTERQPEDHYLFGHGEVLREGMPYRMYFDVFPWTKRASNIEEMATERWPIQISPWTQVSDRHVIPDGHLMSLLCSRRNCGRHSVNSSTAFHQRHIKRVTGEDSPYVEAGTPSERVTDAGYGSRINTANVLAKQHVTMNNYRNLFGRYGPGR